MDVKFLQGTESTYLALGSHEEGTFYLTETNLYLGDKKLTNKDDITAALVNYVDNSTFTEFKNKIEQQIGELDSLQTNAKENLVDAINELKQSIDTNKEKLTVTVTPETKATAGYAKTYDIKQGGTSVGKIDIPKDIVVSSGSVETNPDEKEGTYIVLVLNNGTKLYIDVKTLVDIYTPSEEETAIQLTIEDYKIKAQIKNASITKDMLKEDVLADFLTASDLNDLIVESNQNGYISVNSTDVKIHGLGSAAFTEAAAYDPAGSATKAQTAAIQSAKEYTDSKLTWNAFESE